MVLGQTHHKIQAVVFEPFQPDMTDKFAVPEHQPNALTTPHGHARVEHGHALGGVGIAAAVVEQFPIERYVPRAAAHGDEQNIDLTPAEVPLGAVQA